MAAMPLCWGRRYLDPCGSVSLLHTELARTHTPLRAGHVHPPKYLDLPDAIRARGLLVPLRLALDLDEDLPALVMKRLMKFSIAFWRKRDRAMHDGDSITNTNTS